MTWADIQAVLRERGLIQAIHGAATPVVTGITYDSRRVEPGQVFVALKGLRRDGTAFALDAVGRGASAIVSEQPPPRGIDRTYVIICGAKRVKPNG